MIASNILNQAVVFHQSDQLQKALELYNQVLGLEPENPDALHLAGLVQHQLGENETAADLIAKAINIRPGSVLYLTNYAIVLNILARFGDAELAAENVTRISPDNGLAWHCLGVAQLEQKKNEMAKKSLEIAVSLEPENVEFLNNLGAAYRSLSLNDLAVSSFRKVVLLNSDFAAAQANLAEALFSIKNMAEAERICRKCIPLFSEHAPLYLTLGRILMSGSEFEEAISLFETYLEFKPNEIKGHIALAGAQNIRGDFLGALATLERATTLDPNSAEAMQMLGSLHMQLGDQERAKKILGEAIRLNPDLCQAYFDLSQLRGVELSSQQQNHLQEILNRDDMTDSSRSSAGFTLARCAEYIEDFKSAFSYLEQANKSRLAVLESFSYFFNAETFAIEIQKTIDFFGLDYLEKSENLDESSELPVFVVGLPRSGTTLIERIIASHSKAAGAGELTEIETIVSSVKSKYGEYPAQFAKVKPKDRKLLSRSYLSYVQEREPTAERVVDKNPFNFLHLGLIKTLFPNAAIIHCRRDLRDVGLSCFVQNFADPLPWTNDLKSIGQYFDQYHILMAHWQQCFGNDILTIDYENIVVDLKKNARDIIAHIGLEWDENCLAFHETAGGVQTASSAQVREPLYQRSVGRWKKYEKQLKPLLDRLD